LDAVELTDIGRDAPVGWLYWAVVVGSVPVAAMRGRGRLSFAAGGELVATLSLAAVGVPEAWLSLAGTDTMTVRVDVLVRPALSEPRTLLYESRARWGSVLSYGAHTLR
jgi:hypothetical protein